MTYYLRNFLGSFVGLSAFAGAMLMLFEFNKSEAYDIPVIICGILLMIVGLTLIGYLNAATAPKNKTKQTLFLHSIFVILLFATDLIFGNMDLFFATLRNVCYFVILQFGVYLYVNKQEMSFKAFLKST
ncbi:exosortase [Acinetobacter sp. ANC 5054]|uniref:hypothetical protein n=1 Tax=Acinetobacter sp. ANC 5054 TaxID=1977877 RepID=UPI000A33AE8D|nr:hypothetical protein [Acinetobacter sp. ANC 5054]OTG82751.1 exosortase [Acinetobacter sp. ANC 5054]